MTRSRRRASPTYPPRPTPARPLRSRASVLTARARSALLSVRGEHLSTSDRGVLLEVVKDALLAGRAEILRGEPRGVRRIDEHRHDVSTQPCGARAQPLCVLEGRPRPSGAARRRGGGSRCRPLRRRLRARRAATSPMAPGKPTSSAGRRSLEAASGVDAHSCDRRSTRTPSRTSTERSETEYKNSRR